METYNFRVPADGSNGSISYLDSVAAVPQIERLDIQYCGDISGTSEWFIQRLSPTFSLPYVHEVSPDNTPQFHSAHIINDQLYMYDDEGALLTDETFSLTGLQQVLTFSPGSRQEIWQQVIAQAQAAGTTVTNLNGDIIAIRQPNPQAEGEIVFLLDMTKEVMTGTSIYDASGDIRTRIIFDYESGGESPVLQGVHTATFENSFSSDVPMVSESHLIFHTFEYSKNQ